MSLWGSVDETVCYHLHVTHEHVSVWCRQGNIIRLLFYIISFLRGKLHGGWEVILAVILWTTLRWLRTFAAQWVLKSAHAMLSWAQWEYRYAIWILIRSRAGEAGWGKEAEKIASQIISGTGSFYSRNTFVLILVLLKYMIRRLSKEVSKEASQSPPSVIDKNKT